MKTKIKWKIVSSKFYQEKEKRWGNRNIKIYSEIEKSTQKELNHTKTSLKTVPNSYGFIGQIDQTFKQQTNLLHY